MPIRVRRKREKGYRHPPHTKSCVRGTKYGNPYVVWYEDKQWWVLRNGFPVAGPYKTQYRAHTKAVSLFRWRQLPNLRLAFDIQKELGGWNLSCFCPLHLPCHVDILLKEANPERSKSNVTRI